MEIKKIERKISDEWEHEYFCSPEDVEELEADYKEAIEALTSVYEDYTEHNTEKIRCIIEKAYKYAWEDIRREIEHQKSN